MSKIAINSDVFLRGIKIYANGNSLYVDLIGEATSNIGPVNFNFNKIALDFGAPEQTEVSAFCFKDGKGRIGYNFEFGDVLYLNREDEVENEPVDDEQVDIPVGEDA